MPVLLTEINTLGEQVRPDRGGVIQCHLFEAKACNEEDCSDEVLTLRHAIDTKKRQCCRESVINHDSLSGYRSNTNLT